MRITALTVTVFTFLAVSALPAAATGRLGFQLANHPGGSENPPPYGLRLDELFDATPGHDVFLFDFDHELSDVLLIYDPHSNRVTIRGTVFGGLQDSAAPDFFSADADHVGVWDVHFIYAAGVLVSLLDGDLDITVSSQAALEPIPENDWVPPGGGDGDDGEDDDDEDDGDDDDDGDDGDDDDHEDRQPPVRTNAGTITPRFGPAAGIPIPLVDEEGNFGFSFKFNNREDHRLEGTGLEGPGIYTGRGWLNHGGREHIYASDWLFIATPLLLVEIDLLPRIPPRCKDDLQVRSRGLFSVALLGTADLDVTTVDVETLELEGVSPLKVQFRDVPNADPDDSERHGEDHHHRVGRRGRGHHGEHDDDHEDDDRCSGRGPDGFLDLVLKFRIPDVVARLEEALGRPLHHNEIVRLTLTGNLLEEFGATPLRGCEEVRIKNPGKSRARIRKGGRRGRD